MVKLRTAVMGLAVVFVMAQASFAGAPVKDAKHGQGQPDKIFKELNLTPDQQNKIEANRSAQRAELSKLRQQIGEKQAKLQEELRNPAVTRASVEPLVNDLKSLHARMIDQRINGIFAVKDILTPEQFARFQQMVEKKVEGWKKEKGGEKAGIAH
jgi:Spy/CpxP family protein refolding chaperone